MVSDVINSLIAVMMPRKINYGPHKTMVECLSTLLSFVARLYKYTEVADTVAIFISQYGIMIYDPGRLSSKQD